MEFTPTDYAAAAARLSLLSVPKNRCEAIAHPDLLPLLLPIFIIIGIAGSYIPQHIKIIRNKSSAGISPFFPLLGSISSTCAFTNILVLPASLTDMQCCSEISSGACAAAMLGIIQLGVQCTSFWIILVLFVIYYPSPSADDLEYTAVEGSSDKPRLWDRPYVIAGLSSLHLVLTAVSSIVVVRYFPEHLLTWATILGSTAATLACIQYLPQIHTTYKNKDAKSLSIEMMLIQTPGSFVWATSLLVQLGLSGWTVWGVLYMTATLQGCLLLLALYYRFRDSGIVLEEDGTEGSGSLLDGAHPPFVGSRYRDSPDLDDDDDDDANSRNQVNDRTGL